MGGPGGFDVDTFALRMYTDDLGQYEGLTERLRERIDRAEVAEDSWGHFGRREYMERAGGQEG